MLLDLPPVEVPKLWIPPRPAIIRSLKEDFGKDYASIIPGLNASMFASLAGSGGFELKYIGSTHLNDVNVMTHTFTDQPIGSPSSDRLVIAALSNDTFYAGNQDHFASVTFDGVAGTLMASGNTTHNATGIAYKLIPSGTTSTIAVTSAQHIGSGGNISVWTLKGYKSSTPNDWRTDNTIPWLANALSVPFTILNGGILITIAASTTSTTRTFTGLSGTKRIIGSTASDSFDGYGTGTGTLTCTFNSASYGSMVSATWY